VQKFKSDDLLSLFAHLIIVDHRIHRNEIKAFAEAGLALRLRSGDGGLMDRRDLYKWFERRIKSLKEDAQTKEMHSKLLDLFSRLDDIPCQQEVLDWMCVIALSDGSVHINERLIVALAAGHWDLRPPVWEELRPSKTG